MRSSSSDLHNQELGLISLVPAVWAIEIAVLIESRDQWHLQPCHPLPQPTPFGERIPAPTLTQQPGEMDNNTVILILQTRKLRQHREVNNPGRVAQRAHREKMRPRVSLAPQLTFHLLPTCPQDLLHGWPQMPWVCWIPGAPRPGSFLWIHLL